MGNPTYLTQPTQVMTWVSSSNVAYSNMQLGQVTYISGTFCFMQHDGIAMIASGNFGLADHEGLRQLIHLADGGGPFEGTTGAVRETGPVPFPTASIWWVNSSKTLKVVEKLIVRNPNRTPKTIQWKVYASGSNTVAASVTDTITYQACFEVSRTRTIP